MSDTNRVRVSIARTSQRGGSGVAAEVIDPANFNPANNLFQLRYTGTPGLGAQPNSVISNEIRSDRQTADSILVGTEAGGNTEGELSMLTFDELIQGALFTTYHLLQQSTVASIGSGTITLDADSGNVNSSAILDGMIVRVEFPDNVPKVDNMYFVASKSTDTITVTPLRAGIDPVIGGAETITNAVVTPCGTKSEAPSDVTFALDTPSVGFTTATFANLDATNWAAAYPDAERDAVTLPVAGIWIKFSQFTDTTTQDQYARLVTVTATTAVFVTPQNFTATLGPIGAETYWGHIIRNPILDVAPAGIDIGSFQIGSVAANSFLVERRYEDHSPITRELITGCALNQFNLTFEPQSILTNTVEFFGFKSNVSDDFGGSYADIYTTLPTDVVPTDTDVINTSSNVGFVGLTGVNLLQGDISTAKNLPLQVQLNIGNGLRRRNAVGVFCAASIGSGRLNIGGNVNTYFDSKAILDLIVQNLDAEYVTSVSSNDGRGLLFDLPRIKFTLSLIHI